MTVLVLWLGIALIAAAAATAGYLATELLARRREATEVERARRDACLVWNTAGKRS